MRFNIKKLYRTTENGDIVAAVVTLESEGGQMRSIGGLLGGPAANGSHVTELRMRPGEPLTVTIERDVTLSIEPAL